MADDAEGQPSNTIKDPDDWTTGSETMTGAQASYRKTLCDEAAEVRSDVERAQELKRIDELAQTGRGKTR
jgi:hypothetical protein